MMRRILFVALIIALLVVICRNRQDLNYVLNTLDEMIERVLDAYVKAKY
jgi:hypothetical protein